MPKFAQDVFFFIELKTLFISELSYKDNIMKWNKTYTHNNDFRLYLI